MLIGQLVEVASHPIEHRNRHSVFLDVLIRKAGATRTSRVTTVWLPPLPGTFVPLVHRQSPPLFARPPIVHHPSQATIVKFSSVVGNSDASQSPLNGAEW